MYYHLYLTNQIYGRLTVLCLDDEISFSGNRFYKCRCVCGKLKTVLTKDLRNGGVKSCGCLSKEPKPVIIKHGYSYTRTYASWHSMKQRCYYVKNISYKHYGGKGISVCDRWLNSFENFLTDMGERPQKTSLDRLKSDKNYSKDNCRWATHKQQGSENKQGLHMVYINNESLTLWDAVAKYSTVCYETVLRRIRLYKWDSVRAITTPSIKGQNKKQNKKHSKWLK